VYRLTDGEWEQLGSTLSGGRNTCGFGFPLKINYDGTSLAVWSSSPLGDDVQRIEWADSNRGYEVDRGEVRVYEPVAKSEYVEERDEDGDEENKHKWVQISPGLLGAQPGESFGWALDLSGDGETLSIGASGGTIAEKLAFWVCGYIPSRGRWQLDASG